MGFLDKIKGKKKQAKTSKEENVLDMVKETEQSDKTRTERKLKEDTGAAYQILKSAHLSEKSNALSQNFRYVFKVSKQTNKIEVRKAVEKTYDVHVVAVNIINTKGKSRRMGRQTGQTSDWKKAIVTLKPGEKIAGLVEGS